MTETTNTDELPNPPQGRIAPGSALDTREQFRLYREAMGSDAALRQVRLVREEKARELARLKRLGLRR